MIWKCGAVRPDAVASRQTTRVQTGVGLRERYTSSCTMGKRERVRQRRIKKQTHKQVSRKLRPSSAVASAEVSTLNNKVPKKSTANTSFKKKSNGLQQKLPLLLSDSSQRLLLVGDGDFSFSRSVLRLRGGCGKNLVATSYDSASKVTAKYASAADNIAALKSSGSEVFHNIDAARLAACLDVETQ